jgi:type II secretory pathway component GspD/PulD (secretin)
VKLRNAEAAEIARVLKQVFNQSGVEITPDPRTNQLIVRADNKTLAELAALLEKLDIPLPPPPEKKK